MLCQLEESLKLELGSVDTGKKTRRNERIVCQYLGLNGPGCESMQAVGDAFGVTRESVRQIVGKHLWEARKVLSDDTKRKLSDLGEAIIDCLPASIQTVQEKVSALGYTTGAPGVCSKSLVRLFLLSAELLGVDMPAVKSTKFHSTEILYKEGGRPPLKHFESTIIFEVSHNGAVNTAQLAQSVLGSDSKESEELARQIIDAMDNILWVDSKATWAYFSGRGRNRLITRLRDVFAVYAEVDPALLQEGIRRAWNKSKDKRTRVIPKRVIARIADKEGLASFADGTLTSTSEPEPLDSRPIDREIVAELSKASKALTERELSAALVKDISEKHAFSMALNYSPLLVKTEHIPKKPKEDMHRTASTFELIGTPKLT